MKWLCFFSLISLCLLSNLYADKDKKENVYQDISLECLLKENAEEWTLRLMGQINEKGVAIPFLFGLVAIKETEISKGAFEWSFDKGTRVYSLVPSKSGSFEMVVKFVTNRGIDPDNGNEKVNFALLLPGVKNIKVVSEIKDLELTINDLINKNESLNEKVLTVTGLLPNVNHIIMSWSKKTPEVQVRLLASAEFHNVVTVGMGFLSSDIYVGIDIMQGVLTNIPLQVPEDFHVTDVKGANIKEWKVSKEGGKTTLLVSLNQKEKEKYSLQIKGEKTFAGHVGLIKVPNFQLPSEFRSFGHLMLGTHAALQILVIEKNGLSQIDAQQFPANKLHVVQLPTKRNLYYQFPTQEYSLDINVSEMKPVFEIDHQISAIIKDDNLLLHDKIQLNVREAPLRAMQIKLPKGFRFTEVKGPGVNEDNVSIIKNEEEQTLSIPFTKPVMGSLMIDLALETGASPIDKTSEVSAITVFDAIAEKGSVVLVGRDEILLEKPKVVEMREVHTGSLSVKLQDAQYAYKFRGGEWGFGFLTQKKKTHIFSEALHTYSLLDQMAYGNIVYTYKITGSAIDTFYFSIPEDYENVEFIGKDVLNWKQNEKKEWVVKLRKKVSGDYNMALSYLAKYSAEGLLSVGRVYMVGVESQSGFIVLTSQANRTLESVDNGTLIPIAIDELPESYRFLVQGPVIQSFKFLSFDHAGSVKVKSFNKDKLIPALIEMTNIQTEIFVKKDSGAEGVTTVRYKIKNSQDQFLDIVLPQNAVPWYTKIDSTGADNKEIKDRVNASKEGDVLKIPLPRKRNPNEPITVEIQYGQPISQSGNSFSLSLKAPKTTMVETYASWGVKVPEGWYIKNEAGGNMICERRIADSASFAGYMNSLFKHFVKSSSRLMGINYFYGLSLIFGSGLLFLKLKCNLSVISILVRFALLTLIVMGVYAGLTFVDAGIETSDVGLNELLYYKVLHIADQDSLAISAFVQPSWLIASSITDALVGVALFLCALYLIATKPAFRWVGLAILFVTIVYVAHQFVFMRHGLSFLVYLGLPLALFILLLKRQWASLAKNNVVVLFILGLCLNSLTSVQANESKSSDAAKVESALHIIDGVSTYELVEKKDHFSVKLNLNLNLKDKEKILICGPESVVLGADEKIKNARWVIDEKGYWLDITKKGKFEISIEYYTPLLFEKDVEVGYVAIMSSSVLSNVLSLKLTDKNLKVISAFSFNQTLREEDGFTRFDCSFMPFQEQVVSWVPKVRDTKTEEVSFQTDIFGLFSFDTGVSQANYSLKFQVTQGQINESRIKIPSEMKVVNLESNLLQKWFFDEKKGEVFLQFSKPVTGTHTVFMLLQATYNQSGYQQKIVSPKVVGSGRERVYCALRFSDRVNVEVPGHVSSISTEDFVSLVKASKIGFTSEGVAEHMSRFAFQFADESARPVASVEEVKPELRSEENGTFLINHEKLIYNAEVHLLVSKAGLFSVDIALPLDYELDRLEGGDISHFDEIKEVDRRLIQVHFYSKLKTSTKIYLYLSRSITDLKNKIHIPEIRIVNSLKHTGQVTISPNRDIRPTVLKSSGVSERDALQMSNVPKGALVYKILDNNWGIKLSADVLQPRLQLDFLHLIKVDEGAAHHTHYLRYKPYHAGIKMFKVRLPKDVIGITFNGPEIANKKQSAADPDVWEVELNSRWYDSVYPLQVSYDQVSSANSNYTTTKLEFIDVEQIKGFLVLYSADKIELVKEKVSDDLQIADARSIPIQFGAGDLSNAILCYQANNDQYFVQYVVKRHAEANLLKADSLTTMIESVVNSAGQILTRAHLTLSVGSKRDLRMNLPEDSVVWSVMVNGKFESPYLRSSVKGEYLIPLLQNSFGESAVEVEVIYVQAGLKSNANGKKKFEGPRFDLPLKNINWTLYLPENFEYNDFEGSLALEDNLRINSNLIRYDMSKYEEDIASSSLSNKVKSLDFQKKAQMLSEKGQQTEALQSYKNAYNWSYFDQAFNEDARVQLNNLSQQQAAVGLVTRRNKINYENSNEQEQSQELSNRQSQDLLNGLLMEDNDNIQFITESVVNNMAAVDLFHIQLQINLPKRGKKVVFNRSVQVEPYSEMDISFDAKINEVKSNKSNLLALLGFGLLVVLSFGFISFVGKK